MIIAGVPSVAAEFLLKLFLDKGEKIDIKSYPVL